MEQGRGTMVVRLLVPKYTASRGCTEWCHVASAVPAWREADANGRGGSVIVNVIVNVERVWREPGAGPAPVSERK
jgi:hypothetical protein